MHSNAELTFLTVRAINDVFLLVFIYFFVSVGLVVILYGIIAWIGKADKTPLHWTRLIINLVIGVSIVLISAVASSSHNDDDSLVTTYVHPYSSFPTITND